MTTIALPDSPAAFADAGWEDVAPFYRSLQDALSRLTEKGEHAPVFPRIVHRDCEVTG